MIAAASAPAQAREWLVYSQAEYASAARQLTPGDRILLADGEWKDFQIRLTGQGRSNAPIRLAAQTPGNVVLTGASNLKLSGRYLEVSGLTFRNGYSPDDQVIAFRTSAKAWADDSRVTGIVIDRFNKPDRRTEDNWVAIYGRGNRVDQSHFEGKANGGAMLIVVRQKGMPLDNRARIDHNYFGPRPPLGSNGGETIRIGTSTESGSDSGTVVEDNLFERCDGEVEIVSVKSGGNMIRRNTFLESQGSLVLRHGSGNIIEGNVFLGRGVPHSGGIRVINERQVIRNNYLEGLAGTDFTSAIAVMNGVPNSPVNRYMPVRDVMIERNSIVEVARITIGAGADAERSQAPRDVRIAGNLISGVGGKDPLRIEADASGVQFAGNVLAGKASAVAGIPARNVALERAENGLLYPRDRTLTIGASRDLRSVARESVGVAWYAKPAQRAVAFDSGRTIDVRAGASLGDAVKRAGAGDAVRLAPGSYTVAAPIVVDRPLTLRAARGSATIRMHTTLFQLEEGGALQLDGVAIDGSGAAIGSAVIRASARPMLGNYRVRIAHSRAANVPGDVIASSPATLAEAIAIDDSDFEGVAGAVVAAHAETGADGLYSAERVTIADSRFVKVGTIADLYRGGTDESTFGPHFAMTGSTVTDSGAVLLSGVQEAEVRGNRFVRSKGVAVVHSVGAPDTRIAGNTFAATPAPSVRELHYAGPPRAALEDNVMEKSL
ncbi:polysaccharide lyase 6 family protein [Sphingomonas sp. HF-S4]|uniref:Polysaccharide lyase 6 family protein n=1 Tax=Sphingomonas agrestis TaxID=3080540 RepID=A0ABU3Y3D7_9SPHN|nr:polysaccharide lyase 6 family protein [Sphingomonas sp. HF-S4]MDV3455884.1 polysaccharide lyase 6 family protein [Sphingomonas sp. HF-S4]